MSAIRDTHARPVAELQSLHPACPAQVATAAFLDGVDRDQTLRHMRSTWNACQDAAFINRMLAYDWRYTLADSDLPKVPRATAMAGIEVGYRSLDK